MHIRRCALRHLKVDIPPQARPLRRVFLHVLPGQASCRLLSSSSLLRSDLLFLTSHSEGGVRSVVGWIGWVIQWDSI